MENNTNSKRNWTIGIIIVIIVAIIIWFALENRPGDSDTNQNTSTSTSSTVTPIASTSPVQPSPKTITPNIPVIRTDGVVTSVPKIFTVSYTATGFSPITFKIQRGQTVHFVNQTHKSLRLASTNPSFNPGFLQENSVGFGGTYDYVFTVPGNWTYQNYDNTKYQGTIIVE
jgi:plastocyanin